MKARLAGLHRRPVTTMTVLAVTAAANLTQFAVPGTLAHFQRTPAELHGQWWRMVTSLFVQDGGVVGTLSNLLFLALIGAAAEQVLSRPRWLLHYFGVGVAAEIVGYFWDPLGGGNSIAVCGLTGAVMLALWRGDTRLPAHTPQALLFWCAALLGTLSDSLYIPAIVAGVIAVNLLKKAGPGAAARPVAAIAAGVTVVLTVAQNIHGGALVLGVALGLAAAVLRAPSRGDSASTPAYGV